MDIKSIPTYMLRFAKLLYAFSCLLWWMTCAPLRFAFFLFLHPQLRFAPLKEKVLLPTY